MESFIQGFEHLLITFDEINSATNKLDETNVIGHGGFGKVYRGELNGREVAIKCLDPSLGQGGPEWWTEIRLLSCHTHENLIALLGFCIKDKKMFLVYEYVSNGSLNRHLRSLNLTWTRRLKICLGAARGLSYLHVAKGAKETVIHSDVKSPNILLDADWKAIVADLGLSKTVPANQQQKGLVTMGVGTKGYFDPEFIKTGVLTTAADVYSFGVVLFEVLCGRICFDHRNNVVIVPTWIESYRQNKLQEIIFDDLKQQIDEESLKTYSAIAFQCLHISSHERPTMPEVVKELEDALRYQELKERMILRENYKEMLMISEEDPLNNMHETQLKMLLLEGTLRNGGKTWLSLTMDAEHCEMISIEECLTSYASEILPRYIRSSEYNSRFAVGCYEPSGAKFKMRVRTQFLSPQIKYTVNLVFKRMKTKEQYIGLEYKIEWRKGTCYSFLSDEREDGWLTAELFQFTSDQKTVEFEILFTTKNCKDLLVEGIEFRPTKKEVLRGENANTQPNKDLCEGTLMKHFGEERFCFVKDGKKCHMLPAIQIIEQNHRKGNQWELKCLSESRFEQVADCITEKCAISCKFSSEMLSPQTTYAVYLVYKRQYADSVIPPVQVLDENSDSKEEENIFLNTPLTPLIILNERGKKTFNPSSRPEIKGLPKLRSDGWIEVHVHELETPTTAKMISIRLRFSGSRDDALKGMTLEGLEFRPI